MAMYINGKRLLPDLTLDVVMRELNNKRMGEEVLFSSENYNDVSIRSVMLPPTYRITKYTYNKEGHLTMGVCKIEEPRNRGTMW